MSQQGKTGGQTIDTEVTCIGGQKHCYELQQSSGALQSENFHFFWTKNNLEKQATAKY